MITPLTFRSLWIDEAMLMASFPLNSVLDVLHALPHYAQAGAPIHNLFLHLFSETNVQLTRHVSFVVIIAATLICIGILNASFFQIVLTFAAVLSSYTILFYATELKHYGFEIIGVALAIGWFLRKDPQKTLVLKDVGILTLSMVLGISTLIVSGIALAIYLVENLISQKKIQIKNIAYGCIFLLLTTAYYLLIKELTYFQISSYPDAYQGKGLDAVIQLLKTTYQVFGGLPVFVALLVAFSALIFKIKNKTVLRFFLLISVVLGSIIVLNFIGLYPVARVRHLVWLTAVGLFVFYLVGKNLPDDRRIKGVVIVALLCLLSFPSLKNTYSVLINQGAFENTQNNDAISWLLEQNSTYVGLWIGAQPAVDAYKVRSDDLDKHQYFGIRNSASAESTILSYGSFIEGAKDIESDRNKPGSFTASGGFYRLHKNYVQMAVSFVEEAPKGQSFYIFASHLDYGADKGFAKYRFNALIDELNAQDCQYTTEFEAKRVFILEVLCSE